MESSSQAVKASEVVQDSSSQKRGIRTIGRGSRLNFLPRVARGHPIDEKGAQPGLLYHLEPLEPGSPTLLAKKEALDLVECARLRLGEAATETMLEVAVAIEITDDAQIILYKKSS